MCRSELSLVAVAYHGTDTAVHGRRHRQNRRPKLANTIRSPASQLSNPFAGVSGRVGCTASPGNRSWTVHSDGGVTSDQVTRECTPMASTKLRPSSSGLHETTNIFKEKVRAFVCSPRRLREIVSSEPTPLSPLTQGAAAAASVSLPHRSHQLLEKSRSSNSIRIPSAVECGPGDTNKRSPLLPPAEENGQGEDNRKSPPATFEGLSEREAQLETKLAKGAAVTTVKSWITAGMGSGSTKRSREMVSRAQRQVRAGAREIGREIGLPPLKSAVFYSSSKQRQSTLSSASWLAGKQKSSPVFEWGSRTEEGVSSSEGLKNAGNTCYVNSAVQALLGVTSFSLDLMREATPHPPGLEGDDVAAQAPSVGSVTSALREVSAARGGTRGRARRAIDASAVKAAVARVNPRFVGDAQQDVHEFLQCCLDCMGDESVAAGATRCPVNLNFRCEIGITRHCMNAITGRCTGAPHKWTEVFRDFSLRLRLTDPGRAAAPSVQRLLEDFFEREEVEYTCEHCGHGASEIRQSIAELPRVISVQLKRFDSFGAKDCAAVEISPIIDLGFCTTSDAKRPPPFVPAEPSTLLTRPPNDVNNAAEDSEEIWEWQDDTGAWRTFDEKTTQLIRQNFERMNRRVGAPTTFEIKLGSSSRVYHLNLRKLTQTNVLTNVTRRIRRVPKGNRKRPPDGGWSRFDVQHTADPLRKRLFVGDNSSTGETRRERERREMEEALRQSMLSIGAAEASTMSESDQLAWALAESTRVAADSDQSDTLKSTEGKSALELQSQSHAPEETPWRLADCAAAAAEHCSWYESMTTNTTTATDGQSQKQYSLVAVIRQCVTPSPCPSYVRFQCNLSVCTCLALVLLPHTYTSSVGKHALRGHYVCDVFSENTKTWKCFNDSVVTTVATTDVFGVDRRRDAYVLIYAHIGTATAAPTSTELVKCLCPSNGEFHALPPGVFKVPERLHLSFAT